MSTPQVSTNSFAEPDDLATPMVSISDINFSTQTPSLGDATPLVCNGTISNGSLPNFMTDNSISYEDMPRTIAAPPTADYQEFAASNETPIQYSAACGAINSTGHESSDRQNSSKSILRCSRRSPKIKWSSCTTTLHR